MRSSDLPVDEFGALRVGPALLLDGAEAGPLAGRTFVVKDLIDVAGQATGGGSPARLGPAFIAAQSADAVTRTAAAGASLIGKAHTDEMAYSLMGQNAHYPSPVNPAAPGRLCGGSSSGSAAATAGGLADFALGTDTGGSIRVPAAYCGLYGLRPTHGRVCADGVQPLAPSFDTVGWFARDAVTAAAVAGVLLDPAHQQPAGLTTLRCPSDLLGVADPSVQAAVRSFAVRAADLLGLALDDEPFAERADELTEWVAAFTKIQGHEAWAQHGAWITQAKPPMGEPTLQRFLAGSRVTEDELAAARHMREDVAGRLSANPGHLFAWPAAASAPPSASISENDGAALRGRLLQLTSPAGLAGAPALTVPVDTADGPAGACLIGVRGTDEHLLQIAQRLEA